MDSFDNGTFGICCITGWDRLCEYLSQESHVIRFLDREWAGSVEEAVTSRVVSVELEPVLASMDFSGGDD